ISGPGVAYPSLKIISRHNCRPIVDGQRLHREAYLISTEFTRLARRDITQNACTVADYVPVDLRVESRRGGAWSIRVREYMRVGHRQRLEQPCRRGELCVALARKSDDDVRSDRRVRQLRVDSFDDGAKVGRAVWPSHRTKHDVGPVLQRQMKMGRDARRMRGEIDDRGRTVHRFQ